MGGGARSSLDSTWRRMIGSSPRGARHRELWPDDEVLAEWPDTEWPEDSFDRSETFED
jgi:hypothetical protein